MINTQKKPTFSTIGFQGGEEKKTCRQFQGGETADSLKLLQVCPKKKTHPKHGFESILRIYISIYLSIWSSLLENWNLSMSEHSSPKRMGDDPVSGMSWNNGWLWNVWPLGTPRIYDSSFALSRSVLVTLHLLVHVPTLWDLHTWVRPGG